MLFLLNHPWKHLDERISILGPHPSSEGHRSSSHMLAG